MNTQKIMEEELNYVMVTFKTKGFSSQEKPNDLDIIYEEVKTEEPTCDTRPVIPENEKKAPLCSLLHLIAVGLGIICVILVSFVIALNIRLNTVMSEQHRENTSFEKQKEELMRERDGLNWTIGIIMEYDTFEVTKHCPQKVCQPCLDDWVLFQSSCYLFLEMDYYSYWRSWHGSLEECRKMKADLVVIESQEEQEFISNHTKYYSDDKHGYWIGLSYNNKMDTWMWVDERNLTLKYWNTEVAGKKAFCALSLPSGDPLANWHKTGCDMRNRWICETRALFKSY